MSNLNNRETTFNAKLHIVQSGHPCVEIRYEDVKGRMRRGYMMVDSCSMDSHLLMKSNSNIRLYASNSAKELDCICPGNKIVKEQCKSAIFSLSGYYFNVDFGLDEEFDLDKYNDLPIVGILGVNFMKQIKLTLDFKRMCLHSSKEQQFKIRHKSLRYAFPMNLGLNYYGIPVIPVTKNGNIYYAALDSGSDNNWLSLNALDLIEGYDFEDEIKPKLKTVISQALKEVKCGFRPNILFQFKKNCRRMDDKSLCEGTSVYIMDIEHIIDKPVPKKPVMGYQLKKVDLLIGAPYLHRNRWVLDFGNKIIYQPAS